MTLALPTALLLIVAGFFAGFINTLAGSGSAFSLAVLSFLGMPMDVANGTNRVGVVLQSLVAVLGFRQAGALDWKHGRWLMIPSVLGALTGAGVAAWLPREQLTRAVGVLMLVVLGLLFVKPKQWLEGSDAVLKPIGPLQWLIFFLIGVYGGFIQIGVGVFLLVALVLGSGYDLIRANALKVVLVLCFTLPAMLVFVWYDLVRWKEGSLLAVGSMAGAWVATRVATQRGAVFVRILLIGVVAVSAFRYLTASF